MTAPDSLVCNDDTWLRVALDAYAAHLGVRDWERFVHAAPLHVVADTHANITAAVAPLQAEINRLTNQESSS